MIENIPKVVIESIPIVANVILLLSAFPNNRRNLHLIAVIGCAALLTYGIIIGSTGLIIGQSLAVVAQIFNAVKFWHPKLELTADLPKPIKTIDIG